MNWAAFREGFWCGASPFTWLAWLLYWIGHAFSLALNRCDSSFWCSFWYVPYNKFMDWSVRVQGESHCGPWETSPKAPEKQGEGETA